MKKFIVNFTEYLHKEPYMKSYTAPDLLTLLQHKDLFAEEITIENAEENNGDGMAFVSIFDVEQDKQVFPSPNSIGADDFFS